jgi:DNA-binding GntR family transcriptional regulator
VDHPGTILLMPRSRKAASGSPLGVARESMSQTAHGASASDVAADYIRRLIFDGVLRQDEHVRQEDIAEQLGISRSPVREAAIALSHEGWLVTEPHRGAFVHGLDEASVCDHYEVLGFVYGLTARRATERQTPEGLARLIAAQKILRKAESPESVLAANVAYLRQLFLLADSSRLTSLLQSLGRNVVPGNFFELVPGASAAQKRGTAAVTKAVQARDAVSAEAACQKLMRRQGDRVVSLLVSRRLIHESK